MAENPTLIPVAPGRVIAVGQFGAADGYPVLFCHGALASWQYRHPDDGIAAALGVRLITAARPGFGASTRQRGRTVADWAEDVRAIADALGIERFAVLGHSGGGPHALCCGVLLGGRVTAVAAAGSLAPFDSPAHFAALGSAAAVYEMATGEFGEFEAGLGRVAELMRANLEMAVRGSLAGSTPVPGLVELLIEDGKDVFAQGHAGWADELYAHTHHWGFELAPLAAPVSLFYGESDALGAAHGEALAAALDVEITSHPGDHFAFFDIWARALRDLR